MCYSLTRPEEKKLTARIIFASLRLSESEPTSTSLYRVFRRILLLLNLLPSMFPSSKAWWSCVQAAQTVSVFSPVRAKRVKQHLLIKVVFKCVIHRQYKWKPRNCFPRHLPVPGLCFSSSLIISLYLIFFFIHWSISYHGNLFTNQSVSLSRAQSSKERNCTYFSWSSSF